MAVEVSESMTISLETIVADDVMRRWFVLFPCCRQKKLVTATEFFGSLVAGQTVTPTRRKSHKHERRREIITIQQHNRVDLSRDR